MGSEQIYGGGRGNLSVGIAVSVVILAILILLRHVRVGNENMETYEIEAKRGP